MSGPITSWSEQFPNLNTKGAYASAVYSYLSIIYDIPKEKKITPDLVEKWETLAARYLDEGRDPGKDLLQYALALADRPPKTARQYLAAVKDWLAFHEKEIPAKDLRKLRQKTPRGGAMTVERDLDPAILRSILSHQDLKMRALTLLLVSSGMRIGEALRLTLDDVVLPENEIGRISIRGETSKNKNQRYTFCSNEAAAEIREWIKKRPVYLVSAQHRGKSLGITKNTEDPRLFPFSDNVAETAWEASVRAAGLHSRDPGTGRLQIHPHMLRKFFSSQMRLVVPIDVVEGLIGHSGYLSDAYRRYTKKQVQEFYLKAEPYVTIQISDEVRELQTTTEKRLTAQSVILEDLIRKDVKREKDLAELKNLVDVLKGLE